MQILLRLLVVLVGIVVAACQVAPSGTAGTGEPLSVPLEMVVVGDFGDGGSAQHEVAERVRQTVDATGASVFVTTGDNFYSNDVDAIWNEPYGWLDERDVTVLAAWGNHDVTTSERRVLVQEALEPPGRWYNVDLGSGILIVLDSTLIAEAPQTEWLREILESSSPPRIVVFHHPAFSCGFHGSDGQVRDAWVPLFDEFEVSLVLNGHDHHYERFVVNDTTYVVTGGGGRSLRAAESCPTNTPEPLSRDDDRHHYLLVEVTAETILAEVIAADGSTIDSFAIEY